MSRLRKKPDYNPEKILEELLDAVSDAYTTGSCLGHTSLRSVAEEFGITILKIRKLLITAGVFSSDICEQINHLKSQGKTIQQIMELTGLSRASVHSYLPYNRGVYNAKDISADAERAKKYRERKAAVQKIADNINIVSGDELKNMIWEALCLFQEYPFYTKKGQKFKYRIRDNELFLNQENISITRAELDLAVEQLQKQNFIVAESKAFSSHNSNYLYPVFVRIDIIRES